ncbi:MAG: hypothetical protein L3K08_03915, partial [Thermoplasmata archaeon]|nr:hypothetical protein [Thermoplasmata archaeon]
VLVLDIRGRSFVWGMVRKIVSALRAHATGGISLSEIESAIRGEERLSLPLAEPDRLVLWEVRHGVRWTDRALGGNRRQDRRFLAETEHARIRRKVLMAIAPWPKERPKVRSATTSGF